MGDGMDNFTFYKHVHQAVRFLIYTVSVDKFISVWSDNPIERHLPLCPKSAAFPPHAPGNSGVPERKQSGLMVTES